jgi:hypothetical protein
MRIYKAFDLMMNRLEVEYGIQPKMISQLSGVSASQLSQFRSGKGSDLVCRKLDKLLDAAEQVCPGAKRIYAEILVGCDIGEADVASQLFALAEKLQSCKSVVNQEKEAVLS